MRVRSHKETRAIISLSPFIFLMGVLDWLSFFIDERAIGVIGSRSQSLRNDSLLAAHYNLPFSDYQISSIQKDVFYVHRLANNLDNKNIDCSRTV